VSVAAVAVGWGQYLNEFLSTFNVQIPAAFANPPGVNGGVFNIPAILVVVLCGLLLLRGTSESATANTVMVFLKIGILTFFCVVAFTAFDGSNFTPFAPLGIVGIQAAASQVFFSYIGFDAASTAGEEAKNPRRDLPIAIILSLVIVTVIYVLVTLAALGARSGQVETVDGVQTYVWGDGNGDAILASIVADVTGTSWAPALISLGAVISIFSVVLTVMYGQTRILFAMGRDGLLPRIFTRVNPRTQTPTANTVIVTVVICLLAGFVPLGQLAEATSIGTLFAFLLVNVGVMVLRRSRPDLNRSFRTPLFPITPILGMLFCGYLLLGLAGVTWLVFGAWMAVGLAVYALYGYKRSLLRHPEAQQWR
jgi:APA family basic amino acid/polyamine antiporter